MIGHDVVNAALEGMNLLFEMFSRKGRKMPRLSIKISDKNLNKVASLDGKRQHWCSYWVVPAIPNEGPFPVPAGFRFHVDKDNRFFVENEAGDHKIQLFEGDYLVLVSPSIQDLIAESFEGETRIWLSKGIFVANLKYFISHWVPGEPGDKSIPALIAKGTLIDTESKDYKEMEGLHSALESSATTPIRDEKLSPHWQPLENSVFDSESSAQSHPDFKDIDHIVINQKNPSNRHLHLMRMLLRDKGYTVAKQGEAIPFEGDVRKTFPLNESSVAVTIVDVTKPSLAEIHICEAILRQQGRVVIDSLNPSKDQLDEIAVLLDRRRPQKFPKPEDVVKHHKESVIYFLQNAGYQVFKESDLLEDSARLLRTKGYTVFYGSDGNLDQEDLNEFASILRNHDYQVFQEDDYALLKTLTEDRGYESGYVKGMQEARRINESAKHLANRAYAVGFEAGRLVEKLGILNGEESYDREERESASEGDSRVGGTFPFTGSVTNRFSSRHAEKVARHGANFRHGIESFRESESRPHSATEWADSEQPQYSEPGESAGDSIHPSDGKATP